MDDDPHIRVGRKGSRYARHGTVHQNMAPDRYGIDVWDRTISSGCHVRLCLADDWVGSTGDHPPHQELKPKFHTILGLPVPSFDEDPERLGRVTLRDFQREIQARKEEPGHSLREDRVPVSLQLLRKAVPRRPVRGEQVE